MSLYMHLSIHLSIYRSSVHLHIYLPIHLSIHLSIYLSVFHPWTTSWHADRRSLLSWAVSAGRGLRMPPLSRTCVRTLGYPQAVLVPPWRCDPNPGGPRWRPCATSPRPVLWMKASCVCGERLKTRCQHVRRDTSVRTRALAVWHFPEVVAPRKQKQTKEQTQKEGWFSEGLLTAPCYYKPHAPVVPW